jgi:hypothetical protein
MPTSVIPAEAELRRIRARMTEVRWMIRALNRSPADWYPEALFCLIKSLADHLVPSLAATLNDGQQFESRGFFGCCPCRDRKASTPTQRLWRCCRETELNGRQAVG